MDVTYGSNIASDVTESQARKDAPLTVVTTPAPTPASQVLLAPAGYDAKLSTHVLFRVEYFNDVLKSWEPFLEPLEVEALLEQVRYSFFSINI